MPGRQAKLISQGLLRRMLAYADRSPFPARNRVIVLLSVKAGLRACEIARLDWSMALDPHGKIAGTLCVRDAIAKKRGGRSVPMHPRLRAALIALKRVAPTDGPVVCSTRGKAMRPNSIVNWFVAMFRDFEVEGCSSHSGRRTFITAAARRAHQAGCRPEAPRSDHDDAEAVKALKGSDPPRGRRRGDHARLDLRQPRQPCPFVLLANRFPVRRDAAWPARTECRTVSDTPGALWQLDWLDRDRVSAGPGELRRIVVAIDPAISTERKQRRNRHHRRRRGPRSAMSTCWKIFRQICAARMGAQGR